MKKESKRPLTLGQIYDIVYNMIVKVNNYNKKHNHALTISDLDMLELKMEFEKLSSDIKYMKKMGVERIEFLNLHIPDDIFWLEEVFDLLLGRAASYDTKRLIDAVTVYRTFGKLDRSCVCILHPLKKGKVKYAPGKIL